MVVTGHQCQWFHPGIVAKTMLAERLAQRLGGLALNIMADSDLPKTTDLLLPITTSGTLTIKRLGIPLADGRWPMEHQPALSPQAISRLLQELTPCSQDALLGRAVATLIEPIRTAAQRAQSLAQFFTVLNHELLEPIGLRWLELPASRMAQSQTFTAFVADMLLQAPRVHHCYNQALATFRTAHGIKDHARPMADLATGDGVGQYHESPFWLFRKGQPRAPLFVRQSDDELWLSDGQRDVLALSSGELTHDPNAPIAMLGRLTDAGVAIRPRAITLTMFVRLFLADTFIHGIGGALYDQVTDTFIERFHHIAPPAFACVSATMRLPLRHADQADELLLELRDARRRLRDWRFNPQRYLDDDAPSSVAADRPDKAWLEDHLASRLAAIAQSNRLRAEGQNHAARQKVFQKIRAINAEIRHAHDPVARRLALREADLAASLEQAQAAASREYFFGLFAPETLRQLLARLADESPT